MAAKVEDGPTGGSHGLRIVVASEPDPETRRTLQEEIRRFNNAVSRHHRNVRQSGLEPLEITIRDEEDRLLGGLAGDTYWGWLEIDDLWLHESVRGRGLGRRLVAMAEGEALARGCSRAFLRTFGFQARGFYEKLGYQVVGCLDDYPPGESFLWMRRELA